MKIARKWLDSVYRGTPEAVGSKIVHRKGATQGRQSVARGSSTNLVARAVRRTAALSLILSGCSGGASKDASLTAPPVPVLTTITVSLSTSSITVGQNATASANGFDQNGASFGVGTVAWSTGSSSIASITNDGVVTGISSGQVSIVATVGAKIGQQSLTVTQVPVATLTMAPTAASVAVGGTQQLTATPRDASNIALAGRVITWNSSDPTRASVSSSGLVTGTAAGIATVTATSEGKTATATITVGVPPVSTVTIAPSTGSLIVGGTITLTASALDANGNILTGRVFTWTSSNLNIVSGTFVGNVLTAQGVSPGTATITATSEGKVGTSIITVTSSAQSCISSNALQLAVGQVVTLSAAQKASLCLGGNTASEYVLIPFNSSTVAGSLTPVTVTSTNTIAVTAPVFAAQSMISGLSVVGGRAAVRADDAESALRARQRRQPLPIIPRSSASALLGPSTSPALLVNPIVGQVVSLNTNGSDACTNLRIRSARIVSISQRASVLVETTAPAGGFSDAELSAFGSAFDTQVYPLDVSTFGAPSDIDNNGRVAILFTTGVNLQTTDPTQGTTLGFFFGRDLVPTTACAGSNVGEMFYMPVPDPNSTINSFYRDKAYLSNVAVSTLAHEFQHLINEGRRRYVNNATVLEEGWLNEGLSHIAEELLYYQQSGQSPRTNIDASVLISSQAQLDAFNTYANGNFTRLIKYLVAPTTNSPYDQNTPLETRGAIWQLLRYSADFKGGNETSSWFALANSTTAGQANFSAVFGDITAFTRAWAIAQFADDAGFGVATAFTYPSWNFRSIVPGYFNPPRFPLATLSLVGGVPQSLTLAGGGAAYVRFRVGASVFATVSGTSSGQSVPSGVDFILVRTQ